MILLRLISWPYVRKHLLRTALTLAGIVLGVAVLLAMNTANQAVLMAFQKTIDDIAGEAQLQIMASESGFPEEVLERVQAVPGVRAAVPAIEAVVDTGVPRLGNLLLLAVDMTGDRNMRSYDLDSGDDAVIDDPLVFLAQPDSIIVTREFASKAGLAVNSRLPMQTMDGEKQFTVRGIMRSGGMTRAFGGNLAVMDIYAAQKVLGRGRTFDRIDLTVKDGVSIAQCRDALRNMLGPGFEVNPPSSRGQALESAARGFLLSTEFIGAFTMFVGMFIIYNSFSIAVTQRRSEIGILRALGATRRQIQSLFLIESAVGGMIGSSIGLALGSVAGQSLAAFLGRMLEDMSGVAARAEQTALNPRLMILAMAAGVVSSMVAAFIPARAAAGVDPVQALQKGKYQVLSAGESRMRRRLAAILACAAALCVIVGSRVAWIYSAYVLSVAAALLLAPALALWLARALRPALKRIRPVEGALAADSLIQAPRRTSGAVAALMMSLALVLTLAGLFRGTWPALIEWLDAVFRADLILSTSENVMAPGFRFPASMGEGLKTIPGVADVITVRNTRIMFRGTPIMLVSAETPVIARHSQAKIIAGERDEMHRLLTEGKGIVVADTLASLHNLHFGEVLDIPTPSGNLSLPIVGITVDYSYGTGTFYIDRSVFRRYWKDETANLFEVYLQPGISVAATRQTILEKFAGGNRLVVLTNADVRQYLITRMDQVVFVAYIQVLVAVLVAVLGIVNTLIVSITDRRRELGVLRAVGALSAQIRHTVWMEALSIGFIGLILGAAFGSISLYYILRIETLDISGLRVEYMYPYPLALMLFPGFLLVAFLSALWPARAAVSGSLVEALEYE